MLKFIIKIVFITIILCINQEYARGQSANWNDTLQTILTAKVSDSIKVSQIEAKTIFLVTNARPEAKDFLKAMERLLLKTITLTY
jgi:hypothetical protein